MVSDKWIEHKDPQDEIYKHILNELKGEYKARVDNLRDEWNHAFETIFSLSAKDPDFSYLLQRIKSLANERKNAFRVARQMFNNLPAEDYKMLNKSLKILSKNLGQYLSSGLSSELSQFISGLTSTLKENPLMGLCCPALQNTSQLSFIIWITVSFRCSGQVFKLRLALSSSSSAGGE